MNPAEPSTLEATPIPARRISPWTISFTIVTLLLIAAAFCLHHPGDGSQFQFYGQWIGKQAPDFTLTDQTGAPLHLTDLRGKVILMTFGFTHCPNICPTTLAHLAAIERSLPPAEQARLRVLFITVDPARDTPAVLKDYVGFYASNFTGLTGSADDIAKVAKAYGAYYEAVLQDSQVAGNYYTVNHSAYIYLIDPAGRYALLYNNDKLADHASMQRDIEHVLGTPPAQ
jgi:protein SCO1/2